MTRKRTNAIPSDRIQLSNQRASLDRRCSGGAKGTGATCAPAPPREAPESCIALTLFGLFAGRNGNAPPPCPPPFPTPHSELARSVGVPHTRREPGDVAAPPD